MSVNTMQEVISRVKLGMQQSSRSLPPPGCMTGLRGAWGIASITLASRRSILGEGLVPQGEVVLVATVCDTN